MSGQPPASPRPAPPSLALAPVRPRPSAPALGLVEMRALLAGLPVRATTGRGGGPTPEPPTPRPCCSRRVSLSRGGGAPSRFPHGRTQPLCISSHFEGRYARKRPFSLLSSHFSGRYEHPAPPPHPTPAPYPGAFARGLPHKPSASLRPSHR